MHKSIWKWSFHWFLVQFVCHLAKLGLLRLIDSQACAEKASVHSKWSTTWPDASLGSCVGSLLDFFPTPQGHGFHILFIFCSLDRFFAKLSVMCINTGSSLEKLPLWCLSDSQVSVKQLNKQTTFLRKWSGTRTRLKISKKQANVQRKPLQDLQKA